VPELPFTAYEPDRTGLRAVATAVNVLPKPDGWGPMPGMVVFSSALPGAVRGAFTARKSDGTFQIFAGQSQKIYSTTGAASWNDATRVASDYTALADGDHWSFAQFGDNVAATQINDVLQRFILASSSDFADAAGSPPQAKYALTESGYLTLLHLSGAERSIHRSALENMAAWTVGVNGSDKQALPDGGLVMGGNGGQTGGWIFSQGKVRRLDNQSGQEIGFTLMDFEVSRGTVAPFSIVSVGPMTFFWAEDGFYELGNPSAPLGAHKVSSTILMDMALADIDQVQCCADPVRPIVWTRYRSTDNSNLNYTDRLIGWDWYLRRWTGIINVNLEWIFACATPGYSLEELDSVLGYASIEDVPFSFDSRFWQGGRPVLAGFNTDHKLVVFEGTNMQATLRSKEEYIDGTRRRVVVRGITPIGDATDFTARMYFREKPGGSQTASTATSPNSAGECPQRANGRIGQAEVVITAATDWNLMSSVNLDIRPLGRR
jgi:hypothetical protein